MCVSTAPGLPLGSPPSMEELSSSRCPRFPGALTELRFAPILSVFSKNARAGGFLLRVVSPKPESHEEMGVYWGMRDGHCVCSQRTGHGSHSCCKGLVSSNGQHFQAPRHLAPCLAVQFLLLVSTPVMSSGLRWPVLSPCP